MPDLFRPLPAPSRRERLRAFVASLGPRRIAAGAAGAVLVAAAAWWLLRSPPLPVEAGLPRAMRAGVATTSSSSAGGAHATGGASRSPSITASATNGSAGGPAGAPAGEQVPTTAPPSSTIVVQAVGKVARPGVYHLPADARVVDLVEAAGGVAADGDAAAVPLAAKLTDGQRVVVPGPGTPAATATGPVAAPPAAAGSPAAEAPLDLNAASAADLDRLPGVGPATAAAILAYREAHGPFRTVDDLGEVRGIGPARLDALRALVRV